MVKRPPVSQRLAAAQVVADANPKTLGFSKSTLTRFSNENRKLCVAMLRGHENHFSDPLVHDLRDKLDFNRMRLCFWKKFGFAPFDKSASKVTDADVVSWTLNNFMGRWSPWTIGSDSEISRDVSLKAFLAAGFTDEELAIMATLKPCGISGSEDTYNIQKGLYTPPFLAAREIVSGLFEYNYPYFFRAYAYLRLEGFDHRLLVA
jgi:hypothetical protein